MFQETSMMAMQYALADGFDRLHLIKQRKSRGPQPSTRPRYTKGIFTGWAPGPVVNHISKRHTGKPHLTQVHTEIATYDMKKVKSWQKLYSRKKNYKGEVAR